MNTCMHYTVALIDEYPLLDSIELKSLYAHPCLHIGLGLKNPLTESYILKRNSASKYLNIFFFALTCVCFFI